MRETLTIDKLRSEYGAQLNALAAKRGLCNLRVFGSVARGDASPESDVDLLVTVGPNVGLDYFGFYADAQDLLGRKVDVVSDKAIHRIIRKQILEEAVPLEEED